MENNANQINSMMCKRNCGFFGNASCDGYCSKCYKEHVKRQNNGSASGRVTPNTSASSSLMSTMVQSNTELKANKPLTQYDSSASSNVCSNNSSSSSSGAGGQPTAPIVIPSRQTLSTSCDVAVSHPLTTSQSVSDELMLASTSVDSNDKKKRSKCVFESCKRKVGLTGFDCRCGGLFCWEHRYSDKHNCQFDYKELGQDQIRKSNPIVMGEKIQKI